MAIDFIPEGYRAVTPYLIARDAKALITFCQKVFNATEKNRVLSPSGTIAHAEIIINDSMIMLADEYEDINARGPLSFGGTPVLLYIYVANVDEVFAKAMKNGAKVIRPLQDQFYGDRSGLFADPSGHHWAVSMHI